MLNRKLPAERSHLDIESYYFWRLANDVRSAISEHPGTHYLAGLLDDVEVVKMHTDSDVLRERCSDLLAEAEAHRPVTRSGGCKQ